MYNVLYGDIHLHLPYSSDCLSEIDISGNINEPSTLTFEVSVTHSRYELISNRAHDQIKVMDDDTLLFCGFVYEIERDIYNTLTVTCKSDLKYLDDTVVRPYSTNSSSEEWQQGMLVAPSDPESLFCWYIEQHNSHCMSAKHFEIGTNEGWRFDANNYILRSSSVTPTTLTEISEKLVESLGGYLFVHYENGHRYIDWVENCESVSTQIIDFGVNITNFSRTDTTDGLYTAIRPEGRAETTTTTTDDGDTEIKYINPTIEIDGAGNPSGIPDGELEPDYYKDGDTIYCQSAVDKYGFIECAKTFEDCTTCKGLLTAGLKELKTLTSPSTSIDIGAYDLSALGVSDPLVVGTLVRVRSKPNNIDEYMLVSGCTLNLVDPSQTSYTLGIVDNALVQQLNASINSAVDTATSLREELERTGETAKDAKAEAKDVQARADSGEFDGRGIVSTAQKYALSEDTETQPENWIAEPPTMTTDEPYLWTYDETTYTDDTTSTTDPRIIGAYGETGETGTGVSSIVRQYAISTSSTTAPTSGWSVTPPAYTSGSYYWERDYITWTTGDVTATNGVLSKGLNSANSAALDAQTTANTAKENANTALTNATNANNKMHYATCSTAGATAAKVATLSPSTDTLTLTSGVSVSVKFTNANTADAPTLNVASTGAKKIYTNGGQSAYWQAGQSVLFTYDGSYWRVASEPVYASTVTVGNSAEDNVYIEASSVQIRNGSTALASFTADKITMGKTNGINAQVDSDSFDVCSGSTPYISMGYNSTDGAMIGTLNQKPLKLSTACDINGDYTWSKLTRSGFLSSWVQRECSYGGWHITTYIPQAGSTHFYAEIIYSGSGNGTVIYANYPGNFKLMTTTSHHASVSTQQESTASSYAGWVYADTGHVSFYPSNTTGASGTTPFTVQVAGYFTNS